MKVVAVKCADGIPTFHQLNNYINHSEMLMATSNYWNIINGTAPGEGIVKKPEREIKIFTNFIC